MGDPMSLISGFTFIKNGLTLGYPILESVKSIEPLCDEIVINVGFDDPNLEKDDGTYAYLRDHLQSPKFKFLKNYWDPNLTSQGLVFSQQTNLALQACQGKYCQYIQGDEALHENDLPTIEREVRLLENQPHIDGLIFKYLHFYGNVDIIRYTRSVYRREVRLIRNGKGIKSWLDAQGFRHANDTKIQARLIDATVYHYGWARKEQIMSKKVKVMDSFYHGNERDNNPDFTYHRIWGLKPFKQTHPQIMEQWINQHRNDLDIMNMNLKLHWKDMGLALTDALESLTGYRLGEYKNYRRVRS
jgi:hypothetical protein